MTGRNGNAVRRMVGEKFGELAVTSQALTGPRGYLRWHCKCSCGKRLEVDGDRLRSGERTACGVDGHHFKRPKSKFPYEEWKAEYSAWSNMRQRCNKNTHPRYKDYGGRGITICSRWNLFDNFAEDMGHRPSPNHSLDRNNANGNYEPSNCKWSTPTEQVRNRRRTMYVDFEGRRQKLADLTDRAVVSNSMVWSRIKWGWPIDEALSLPKGGRPSRRVETPMYLVTIAEE